MTLPPLPPMPELSYIGDDVSYGYDGEDMRAYASEYGAACAAAERERIAAWLDAEHEKRKHLDNHAAFYAQAIRALKP